MTGFSAAVRTTIRTCTVDGCDKPLRAHKMCAAHWSKWRRSASQDEVRSSDPEVRFQKATRWGEPPSYRPELGPCLIFLGADNGNGYGQFQYNNGKRNGYAHRYAWERVHGPIPDGLTVDHLCRVRRCVNVEHMELTDRVDNYLRGVATRDSCPNGHPYTPESTYYKPGKNARCCRICQQATSKRDGLRRSKAYRGESDSRLKYDPAKRDALVIEAVERRLTVAEAAAQLGCTVKYMDKLVGREARARGIPNRKKPHPVTFNGWTEGKTRTAVRARSDSWCERCGLKHATDMHHRKNRSQSGKWHPANIVHLCALCHVEITAHPTDSQNTGFTVLSHQDPAEIPVLYRGAWVFVDDRGNLQPVEKVIDG